MIMTFVSKIVTKHNTKGILCPVTTIFDPKVAQCVRYLCKFRVINETSNCSVIEIIILNGILRR